MALGDTDFSLFVTGRTGVFKSALAAVAQQHFGAEMRPARLPANFASTANALELLAFHAKDALLVVDDFVPRGRAGDPALQATAERLFRAAGNRQGRTRMEAGGRVGSTKPPRGLVLATGEEVPDGESIRARMLIVDVGAGDVDLSVLSACQQSAARGLLAQTMGGYVGWLAGRLEEVRRWLRERVGELGRAAPGGIHTRTTGILADLQAGLEQFLMFAAEAGALRPGEDTALAARCWKALWQLAAVQSKYQLRSDPAVRFLALLRIALATGHAHIADRRGQVPPSAEGWGWRQQGEGWQAMGVRMGWLDGKDLFLEPFISYGVAQAVAGSQGMPLSEQALFRRLRRGACWRVWSSGVRR